LSCLHRPPPSGTSHLSLHDALPIYISLTVNPREMLAIVGPTGVSKSTLVSLIPRFYDPTAGRVLIDHIDIRDVSLFSLRNQITIDRKSTRLNSSHVKISCAVFCLKK